jgi:hypothetical protein
MLIKGQSLSYDFFIASILFILSMALVLGLFTYHNTQTKDIKKANEAVNVADHLSEIWMRKGTPENWEPSNIVGIGLMSDSRLNQTKMNYLNDMGYNKVRSMAGVENYYFYLRVHDTTNNTMFDFGEYPSDPTIASKTRRISMLNQTIVFVDTVVWK